MKIFSSQARSVIVVTLLLLHSQSSIGGELKMRNIPENAVADYQLGGPYTPRSEVNVVVRDSTEAPATGLYNVCYINGFQTQPGATWPAELLVSRSDGNRWWMLDGPTNSY